MVGPTIYLVGLEALSLDHDVAQAAAGGGRGRDGVVVVAGGHGGHHLQGPLLCFIMAPRPLLIPLRLTKFNKSHPSMTSAQRGEGGSGDSDNGSINSQNILGNIYG